MAYLNKLQYKFDSTITIEHAGIKKKEKKMKCLNFVDFFTEATASASVASMEATPLFIIMENLQYNKQILTCNDQ